MNRRMLPYIVLIILGAGSAAINLWLYLLERETQPLLFVGVGLLIAFAGVLSIRRIRVGQQPRR